MSDKELMYIEDAINHARLLEAKCNQCASTLTDANLQNFARQVAERQKKLYTNLYQLLNQ
jgi:hypothetical protein